MPGKVINSLCNQACCFRCYLYGHLYADLCFKGQVTLYLVLYSVVSTAHISQQKIPKVPLKIFFFPHYFQCLLSKANTPSKQSLQELQQALVDLCSKLW